MTNFYHVIKDPVHGTMQFTTTEYSWVKPFIDSPNFQRLRHIKQMGMGDFIFPGAVHTRFNHSLGCSYVASQIAQKIGLADEERQLVMIACLMHDIGHGPFSHAFEGVFYNKFIRHEEWTPYFLEDYGNKTFFTHYNQSNRRYHLTEDKFRDIALMIMHQPANKNVLADIVSSQLDADRLDYLLRDSHFCGVRYGEFDFRWMLHCMAIVQSTEGERLGITHKGVGVVEHYLMARRLMVRNIYHVHKKLALEFFLIQLLTSLSETLEYQTQYANLRETRLGKFLISANRFNQTVENSSNYEDVKRDFLEDNFSNYKELCDYDVFLLIKQLDALNDNSVPAQIASRIQKRVMPKIVRLDYEHIETFAEHLAQFKKQHKNHIQDWQLTIIRSPHQSYSNADDPILVMNEKGTIKPISAFSYMLDAMSNKFEHTVFLCIDAAIANDEHVLKLYNHLEEEIA